MSSSIILVLLLLGTCSPVRQRTERRKASFKGLRGLHGEADDAEEARFEKAAVAGGEGVADRDLEVGEILQAALEAAQRAFEPRRERSQRRGGFGLRDRRAGICQRSPAVRLIV
jgi:hypothetical protein